MRVESLRCEGQLAADALRSKVEGGRGVVVEKKVFFFYELTHL